MGLIQTIQVPLLAVNDTFLTIVEINAVTGDFVKKGSSLMVFETSKTTYDVEAETDGYIELLCEIGKDYEVNTVVANIYDSPSSINLIKSSNNSTIQKNSISEGSFNINANRQNAPVWHDRTLFSNAALEQIKIYGIKESSFEGRAFVSSSDVLLFVGKPISTSPLTSVEIKQEPVHNIKVPVDKEKVKLVPLTKNKRTEIEYLHSVQSASLTSTLSIDIETAGLFNSINPSLQYFKNSLLPIIIYEVARLLREFKELNAYYSSQGIAFYNECNIGFAVDMDKGLKVLKIERAYSKSIREIESDIFSLSEKYLDDDISLNDLTDITFTITDLSAEGVISFIPLINYMNSAILGISSIDPKLERCNLSLTFDHRITEGKLVARFLRALKDRIESYKATTDYEAISTIHCNNCLKTLEEDLSGIGFVKCINLKGEENYICQTCFKGF
jgi:pyruvate/2-oxoglutarate dehydrogenase complex dihydrolipoamide acyltransferase (E2) component